jgi:putative FmdB family regulatory protein
MPFYEYQCQRCGHHLEAMQKISDKPLKKCPKCGKPALTRLMSAPVFRLKGGGWYETDFKSDGEGKRNLADKPDPVAAKDDKKDAAPKEAGAKDGAPKDATPKEAAGKEAAGKEAPGKEVAPKDATAKNEKKPAAASSSASKKGRRNQGKAASRRR